MKLRGITPIDQLEFWLTSHPLEVQEELVSIACMFHPEERIKNGDLSDFLEYLDGSSLSDLEIVARTLSAVVVLNFAFTNRATEADWSAAYKQQVAFRDSCAATGEPTGIHDDWLARYEYSKSVWIALYESWSLFMKEDLTNKYIESWFFSNR